MRIKATRNFISFVVLIIGIIAWFGPTMVGLLNLPADVQAIARRIGALRADGIGVVLIVAAIGSLLWINFGDYARARIFGTLAPARMRQRTQRAALVRATNANAVVSFEAIDSDMAGFDSLVDTCGEKASVKLRGSKVRRADGE